MVELGSDVDRIGFAIYRTVDGQCVDLWEAVLLKEINIRMHLDSSPSLISTTVEAACFTR